MTAVAELEASCGVPPDVSQSISASSHWSGDGERDDTSITAGLRREDLIQRLQDAIDAAAVEGLDGIETSTIQYAYEFAAKIPTDLPLPDVAAEHDGDLEFEWYFGPRRVLSISIRRDGGVAAALLNGWERESGSYNLQAGIPSALIEKIARVSR